MNSKPTFDDLNKMVASSPINGNVKPERRSQAAIEGDMAWLMIRMYKYLETHSQISDDLYDRGIILMQELGV